MGGAARSHLSSTGVALRGPYTSYTPTMTQLNDEEFTLVQDICMGLVASQDLWNNDPVQLFANIADLQKNPTTVQMVRNILKGRDKLDDLSDADRLYVASSVYIPGR